ncbi:ATP-binding protein [Ammoniphilus sp. YIM 78166]|uniref:ATP-binding protein n=1 Tax=Ammoniphilus sp. YIM 78166 TaxID=1644106 RepID=UPI00106FA73D|nr:ATP-binding protein [Ammoniphilus sp. YIM 78166]
MKLLKRVVLIFCFAISIGFFSFHYLTEGRVPVADYIGTASVFFFYWLISKLFDKITQLEEAKRLLLEQRLEESENRYTSLFLNNTDAVLSFDLKGNLVQTNPATEKITGYTLEELQEIGITSLILSDNVGRKLRKFSKTIKGEPQEGELCIVHKNGKTVHINLKMIPIVMNNQITGVYGIAKDISESKQTEELIRQSEKLAAVGQLAAGVAHEIRNPLTTIKGFIQYLRPKIGPYHTDIMLAELDRINFIVGEFLVLSKPQKTQFKEHRLESIVENVILFLESQANLSKIQFISHFNTQATVTCDENQLKQVFINLLKNAMESMPNGGQVRVELKAANDNLACVRIQDEGCGIPESQIKRLGEPFYTTKEDGTGLGLMVSQRIIQNHGGHLIIDSQPHQGTTASVFLKSACHSPNFVDAVQDGII